MDLVVGSSSSLSSSCLCWLIVVAVISLLIEETTQEIIMGGKKKGRVRITPSTALPPLHPNSTATEIVKQLQKGYDRNQPPQRDRPTEVKLGILINSFFSISEQTMDFSLSMYFRQKWRDPRLSFVPINGKVVEIRLHDGSWNELWVPDTFFRNEKSASFHKVTVANRLLNVNATGHMWYVTRITATLSCPMKLNYFPFDTQMCPIQFESFGYTMDTMYFGWLATAVDLPSDLSLPQFSLVQTKQHDCSSNYTSGSYPCSEIVFVIQRDIGYFIIQVFVPSILTVILSWVSFWINIDGVPARVSLGLLTVLTITTQSTGINTTLPRVSYIKAIDIWMISCLVFVFCALLEYAFVNVAARNGVRIRTPIYRSPAALQPSDLDVCLPALEQQDYSNVEISMISGCFQAVQDRFLPLTAPSGGGGVGFTVTIDAEGSKRRARSIDKFSRKIFPLAFLLFNVVYWISASIPSSSDHQYIEL